MTKLYGYIFCVTLALLFAISALAQPDASVLLPGAAANYNINTTDINSIHTRTKLFRFANHLVSDVAYIVQNSLSKYGTLTIDEPNNLLIITDEANKLDDVMNVCSEIESSVSALFKRIDKKGRVVALEILIANPAVRNLIREAKTHQIPSMIQTGKKYGMVLLDDYIMELFQKRQISAEEAYAKANEKSRFRPLLNAPPEDFTEV